MIKALTKLLRALCSNTNPGSIACGFAFGMLLGFMPKNNLLWYILCIFILFTRIQRGTYAIAMIIGSLIAPWLDPYFDAVGYAILTWEPAIPTYTWLLNIPFVSFTKFHNTIVMGSLACGIMAFLPLYLFSILFTFLWRKYVAGALLNLKVVKAVGKLPFVQAVKKAIDVADVLQ